MTSPNDYTQATETDECQNPHGADGIVACWSPGGPCPAGQTVCESCGPCYECRPGEHPCPPAKEADDSQRERFPFTTPHGSDAQIERDAVAAAVTSCCERTDAGSCRLPFGHDGDHEPPSTSPEVSDR